MALVTVILLGITHHGSAAHAARRVESFRYVFDRAFEHYPVSAYRQLAQLLGDVPPLADHQVTRASTAHRDRPPRQDARRHTFILLTKGHLGHLARWCE